MTSCLLVKAPDRLVAVADGRLSVGETAISFETTRKIVRVVPRYRVPYVSVGRFSHYGDHVGREVFVAYAGAYALIAEILHVFRSRITERLILVWRDGAPVLSESFDRSAQFLDDYDFRPEERPDIDPRLLLEELRAAIQEKADEWCRNRALRAECEFLLFGKDKANAYFAYRVSIDPAWSPGGAVRVLADPIGDGELAAIGSANVLGAAFGDPELTSGLEGWRVDQERIGVDRLFAGLDEDDDAPIAPRSPPVSDPENWPSDDVVARFSRHIRDSRDRSVGGELVIARGGWYGEVSLRSAS